MNIEFGTSNRGRPTLIYQGYEYVKKQETNTTTHWIQTLINSYDENKENIVPFLRSIAHLQ